MTATSLPVPPAGIGRRFAAYLVDQVVGALLGALAWVVVLVALTGVPAAAGVAILVGVALLAVGYGVFLWGWLATRGLSPGKKALGIRVVSLADGRPIGWGRAFVRQLVLGLIVGFTAGIGGLVLAVVAARDPLRQGWHDKAAGSVVIGRWVPSPPPPVMRERAVPGVVPVALPGTWSGVPVSMEGTGGTDPIVPTRPLPPSVPATAVPAAPRPIAQGPIAQVPGVVSEVPGAAPAPALAPTWTSAPAPTWEPPPAVPGAETPAPPWTPPPAVVEETRHVPSLSTPGTAWVMQVGGRELPVTGPGLIGRDPEPRAGETVEHLVPVDDPHRSVSKTHLAFEVDDSGFWVRDRGSTNGSTVVDPGGIRRSCPPGERVPVPPGSTVLVGDLPVRVERR